MMYPAFFVFVLFCVHQCSSDSLGDEDLEIVETDAEFSIRVVENRKITGKDCEYIKLCDVIKNGGCEDGNKFVIRKMKGTRKQFLILNGNPVLGFVQKKKKFTSCKSYTQITANLKCKVVSGLSSLNLTSSSNNSSSSANSSSSSNNSTFFKSVFLEKLDDKDIIESTPVEEPTIVERVIRGNDCEFIKICDVTSNTGCSDGNKLVLKKKTGLRRQFLLLNGSPVLGFVQRKKKFTSCSSYTDITAQVDCKGVSGLNNVDLSSSSNSSSSTNTSSSTNGTVLFL
eukprot:TRINITY_DN12566_c0_g1_i1.p1 TRINITY_DN12566_c0_g1~~TRINITY_DN12566_c0_g1_i1.p1  ORF type:complete len:284 (-),score=70.72 TRINITY_DN12566_c0_g1_i1:64-915(-)